MTSDHAAAMFLLLEARSRASVRRAAAAHGGAVGALDAERPGAERAIKRLKRTLADHDVWLLASGEPGFPARLEAIPDPPLVVATRGDRGCFDAPAVAIVGARRASLLGLETARAMARTLAEAGIVVVSGLALGIDAAAHAGALEAQPGRRTIAVLGSGLGHVQPVTNRPLARTLLQRSGLLVSEYALDSQAAAYRFPERNRLISALSQVVVVVEAGERSGSLITARLALEQGREVLAVPGAISQPNSRGVNGLIKQGAGVADSVQDVLDALGNCACAVEAAAGGGHTPLSEAAADLLAAFRDAAATLDELAAWSGLAPALAAGALAELELAGFVARAGGGYIRRPFSESGHLSRP